MPSVPQSYYLDVVQGKQHELVKLKERYEKKHKKYSKASDRLTWLNACLSGLSVASGISSAAMSSMLIDLPVSIPFSAISLAGASVSGMAMALTKKYQKKLAKVTKLVDIVTSELAVFEQSISKALNDHKIDEWEFDMIQTLYYELANVNHKMEAEIRSQLQKVSGKKSTTYGRK